MKVREARELLGLVEDQEAPVAICAHAFPGLEDSAWAVNEIVAVPTGEGGSTVVLIEGAAPPGQDS
jgi:hypothetical protein